MWTTIFSLLVIFTIIVQIEAESVGEKIFRKIVQTCGQPRINNIMRNLTLNPGDTARFRCTVDMKCMVSYIQWHHEMNNGSVRLLRTGATQGTPYRYIIRRVTPQDSGFYSCAAGNILGETVSSAYLQISGAPSLNPCRKLLLAAFTITWTSLQNQNHFRHLLLMIHVMVINHIVRL